MNDSAPPPTVYIDTSALRAMSFNKDVASLLAISKAGHIRVYISETTLWERGRQQYERDFTGDRVVPFPDGITRYLAWFKTLFEKHGVFIIQSNNNITKSAKLHIQNSNTYFKQEQENDQRDAHVLATAELCLEKSALILCQDKDLAKSFTNIAGFSNVRQDPKNFILEIIGENAVIPELEKPSLDSLDAYQISTTFTPSFQSFINTADHRFHEYLKTLPSITDKLSAKLANMQVLDAEIRKRILGYAQWFSPIGKADLYNLLESRRYGEEQINSNAQRLKQEQLLIETASHWLTNTKSAESKEICEQAMSAVMPEILEIMELT